jgi:DNA-binding transcriptional MocR family regulator
MAGEIVGHVLKLSSTTVTRSEKLLLVTLANFSNRQGGHAFPSVRTLMAMAGLSRRSVQRLLRKLEARGFVAQEAPPGRYRPRTFRLSFQSWAPNNDAHGPSRVTSDDAHGGEISPSDPSPMGVISDAMGVIATPTMGVIAMAPDPSVIRQFDPSTKEQRRLAAAAPPEESYRVLQRLAHDIIDADPTQAWTDQLEALKQRAADLHIGYDAEVIGKALGGALMRRRLSLRTREEGQ